MRPHVRAGTFLFCCLVLLLGAGIYQRIARPSLEYHLRQTPARLPEKPIPSSAPGTDAAVPQTTPLTPEDAETLANAMRELRGQPDNPEIYRRIADIFIRHKDWHNAAKFLERAAALTPRTEDRAQKTP